MKAHLHARVFNRLPVITLFLSLLCLSVVFCFWFPELLTTPEVRQNLPIPLIQFLLKLLLITTTILTAFLLIQNQKKQIPILSLIFILLACAMGGLNIPVKSEFEDLGIQFGLDWLALDLTVLAMLFIPLETFFPQRKFQKFLRPEFRVDLTYFAIGHLGIQLLASLTQKPAHVWFANNTLPKWWPQMTNLPIFIQVFLLLLISDVIQYGLHRLFHTVPFLWRFHSIHHSIRTLDWLAGSRLHLVDIVIVRGLVYFSLLLTNPLQEAFWIYIFIMAFHTVFIHSNINWNLRWLEKFIVTPRYHHWHHNDQIESYDKNFAVHFPIIDMLLGTHYLPSHSWPKKYGVETQYQTSGYLKQFIEPFCNSK